jgi:hypothetical protein
MLVYKFMESRWANAFVRGESVRISPLSTFRNTESHALKKGDRDEGLTVIHAEEGFVVDRRLRDEIARETGITATGVKFAGSFSHGAIAVTCQDHYVFCATCLFDQKVAAELDEKYDCCVRIPNSRELARRLTTALRAKGIKVRDPRAKCVKYKPRVMRPEVAAIDADPFFKGPDFAGQAEYRIAWRPIEPIYPSYSSSKLQPVDLSFDAHNCGLEICWQKPT